MGEIEQVGALGVVELKSTGNGIEDGSRHPADSAALQLAAKLKRPLSTLRYWRHTGDGPKSFKLGGRVVYKAEDVEQWIEAQYNDETAGRVAG